jgi:hypothetical protein
MTDKKRIELIAIIGFMLIGFQSCDKEPIAPAIKKFDMQYLVHLNGDHNVT